MLSKLSISNYALINKLQVDFHKNLNSVTGETGAGKSIILGALGLILGNRADLSVLKNKDIKCIVEGQFEIEEYLLNSFFEANDLDLIYSDNYFTLHAKESKLIELKGDFKAFEVKNKLTVKSLIDSYAP